MIQEKNFDYSRIVNELEITNMKIDMKNKNIKKIKNTLKSCFVVGIIVGIFIFICALIPILFTEEKSMILLNLLKLLGISLLFFVGISLFIYFDLSRIMDFSVLKKLKQFSTKNHTVYKYRMDIKSIYKKRTKPIIPSGVGTPLEQERQKYGMTAGNVLVVDNQNVYLTENTYNEIAFDKEIILYIVECENNYVLYDYERIISGVDKHE